MIIDGLIKALTYIKFDRFMAWMKMILKDKSEYSKVEQ